MPRVKKVGTGITRHARIHFDLGETSAFAAIVDPKEDFARWIGIMADEIAAAVESSNLPAPGRVVEYEKQTMDWKYADSVDLTTPGNRTYARAESYLQSFAYQSKQWYLGRLLHLLGDCQQALASERWLLLAGNAFELGSVWRESRLKFSGQTRLETFEKHIAASDRGNITRKKKAAAWKAEARRIEATIKDISSGRGYVSKMARRIIAKWPVEKMKQPSFRALSEYLAKRA